VTTTWSAALLPNDGRVGAPVDELLRRPVEEFLAMGGDERQIPRDGRNAYGLPLLDEPVVRGSSCTATAPDAVALESARRWRGDLSAHFARHGTLPSREQLRSSLVERLVPCYELSEDDHSIDDRRIVLVASGTDAEAVVSALAVYGCEKHVRNVVVGALEAGSGTLRAAAGRYFNEHTPFRAGVPVGEPVRGFPSDRVEVVDVEIRDARGRARRPFDVEAEVEAHVEDAIERGERVLVHVMAGSKTDLRHLDPAWVRAWRRRFPADLRVLVDGAQGRIGNDELAAYRRAGASISVTGSKAMSGPPFCGALFLDDGLLSDAAHAAETRQVLPPGLADLVSAVDLPRELLPLVPDAQPANLPLLARWCVALDEAERLASIPRKDRDAFVSELVVALSVGLERTRGVRLVPGSTPAPTIVSFAVLDSAATPHHKAALADFYEALVELPGVRFGQPVELTPGGPAALRFAVGATTVTRALAADELPVRAATNAAALALSSLDLRLPEYAYA
jgi:hypothetical protein